MAGNEDKIWRFICKKCISMAIISVFQHISISVFKDIYLLSWSTSAQQHKPSIWISFLSDILHHLSIISDWFHFTAIVSRIQHFLLFHIQSLRAAQTASSFLFFGFLFPLNCEKSGGGVGFHWGLALNDIMSQHSWLECVCEKSIYWKKRGSQRRTGLRTTWVSFNLRIYRIQTVCPYMREMHWYKHSKDTYSATRYRVSECCLNILSLDCFQLSVCQR